MKSSHRSYEVCHQVEILPTGLPDLSITSKPTKNLKKHKKLENMLFCNSKKSSRLLVVERICMVWELRNRPQGGNFVQNPILRSKFLDSSIQRPKSKETYLYAHIEVVVAFLVVNFFGFLVITRNHTMRFGPKLEEIFL